MRFPFKEFDFRIAACKPTDEGYHVSCPADDPQAVQFSVSYPHVMTLGFSVSEEFKTKAQADRFINLMTNAYYAGQKQGRADVLAMMESR